MSSLEAIKRDQGLLTFEERLRRALRKDISQARASVPRDVCLLLDVSRSMNAPDAGPNLRRIDALRKLAYEFEDVRRFVFSADLEELTPSQLVPEPQTTTNMHMTFLKLKSVGIKHAVMITDGRPSNERASLEASAGLVIDVFYVGPEPAPEFLARLARNTGGQYGKASLSLVRELSTQVRKLLA